MKILTILGARPQFIKAGVVSRALKNRNIEEVIVHTGQHFDAGMSDIFFEEMQIPKPLYNLGINNLGHGAMTGRMIEKIEEILLKDRPDMTLVYGDTNSTLAGALASVKLHIPIAHVEAGLRSFDMKMPEEINRIVTDRISKLLFCPTSTAVKNLHDEGFKSMPCNIIETGDVMYDALLFYKNEAIRNSSILKGQKLEKGNYALATVHRAENTDSPEKLNAILEAFKHISKNITLVWPVHPRTKSRIKDSAGLENVRMIEPVGYFDMLNLLANSKIVLTDSGGLQKEAYMMEKFCITLREHTEWTELVEAGVNKITDANLPNIINAFDELTQKPFPAVGKLYGDGHAAERIVDEIVKHVSAK